MISELPLAATISIFVGAALVIGLVGTLLTNVADRLADQTGMGEAVGRGDVAWGVHVIAGDHRVRGSGD